MVSKFVDMDIRRDEGFRSSAYADPITGGAPWTIGFGCTGPEIRPGVTWTLAQATAEQTRRRQEIEAALDHALSWWRNLNDERQDVLVNMAYNMGVQGLLKFDHMLEACEGEDYAEAAAHMLESKWATQVSSRAKRLAKQMLTGARA